MVLKYISNDVEKMIDAFAIISDNKENYEVLYNEMVKLVDYPVNILHEFLKCMEALSDKDQSFLKENYLGVIGYITMRLNFC